ncbi:MAG: 23S rRNA (guanosine(2251)-2'-O)-methyltransferase RlmB [Acidimicrobiales bacterium]|nr:23S rRNA (guanosine(2251)-2'-O)-methyltransferase RlmB [Actinomycetota bacterium]
MTGAPRGRPPRRGGPNRRPERSGGRPPRREAGPDKGLGGEQVEGRQAVAELLLARRRRVREVWLAEDLDPAELIDEIVDRAERLRVPVRRVSRARLEAAARTEAPQGVLAHAEPLPEAEFEALCRPSQGLPLLLAVDGVTDPQNLGALLRTAEAAGATGAVLPRHRAVHVTPAVTKAAAGAVERLPIALVTGLPTALTRAKELGIWVVGLVTDSGQSLFDLSIGDAPVMAVLGAEGSGLSRLVAARCDVLATIPLRGAIPSLNVGAAGAVALFELARQRSQGAADAGS